MDHGWHHEPHSPVKNAVCKRWDTPVLTYLPLTTTTMLEAAYLWAQARQHGQSVADPKELDGDVILAAQARQVGAMVATENVGHLALFVEAKSWRAIAVEEAEP